MSKPSQTHLYAGLLIYRLQRNVEFLLINDSFTNKKHWVCPKGLVLGQEDELKCALRETFETTGLGPKLLHIDEGFKLELKYLSGTKPKKVIYYLAQLLDNHARLHANAEGIHLQWCNQQLASEKAIFKSMQDVFKHAQNFIETKRMNQKQQHQHQRQYKHSNSNNNNSNNNGRRNFNQQQQQQQHRISTPPRPRINNGDTNDTSTMNSPHFRHQQNQQYKLDRSHSSSSMGSLTSPTSPKLQHTSNNNGHYHDTVTDFSNNNNININNNNGYNYRPINNYHHSNNNNNNQQQQQHQLIDNSNNNNNNSNHLHGNGNSNNNNNNDQSKPLFKTRLCERFESESGCPYGSRCTFAHGIEELRGRNINNENQLNPTNEEHNQQQHYHHHQRNGNGDKGSDSHNIHQQQLAKDLSENPLYKTKLCERFMKDQFCQYGPKCHFAHGRNELKERPIQREPDDNNNIAIPPTATTVLPANATTPIKDNHFNDNKSNPSHPYSLSPLQSISPLACQQSSLEGPHQSIASEIITTTTTSTSKGTPSTIKSPTPLLHNDIQQQQQQKENILQKQPTPTRSLQDNATLSLKEKLDQVKINNNNIDNINIKKRNVDPVSDPVINGDIKTTDKSWMKVVHLTKEDQAKLAIPPVSKVPTPSPSKVAQEEAIIEDLTLFFKSPESNITQQSQNLAKDVKQVTKVEMRNDLTKSQLFYILLASLLQDTTDCPVGSILKSREKLFKTFVKNVSDQRLLLKAWDKCVKRYPSLLSKSVLVLSQWYECDLLDEDACYEWYDTLDDTNDIKKKVTKFIDWLKTADEEEEENDD